MKPATSMWSNNRNLAAMMAAWSAVYYCDLVAVRLICGPTWIVLMPRARLRSPMTSFDAETDFKPIIIIIIFLFLIALGTAFPRGL